MLRKFCSLSLFLALAGCATAGKIPKLKEFTSNKCQILYSDAETLNTEQQLEKISELYKLGCYKEVIPLAQYHRSQNRDKFYSMSAELGELVTPEGTLTPYVLESYERSFLSLLISMSYLNTNQLNEALVELRRTSAEEAAGLYNFGEDPVISLVLAALWDRFDTNMSRPHWLRLSQEKNLNSAILSFSKARIQEIDKNSNTLVYWKIFALGELPNLDWHPKFFEARPYQIVPTSTFPNACSSTTSVLVPTTSWTEKIASKYDSDYHPFLYAKSLARLPIGIGYGILGVTAGTAVGIGGCGAAVYAKDGAVDVCNTSLKVAGYLINKSADLVAYTLKPDLRRWKSLPLAILLTRESSQLTDPCSQTISGWEKRSSLVE